MDLGAFELAFDALRFDNCCAVWKEAIRLSKVKNSSATSGIAILGVKCLLLSNGYCTRIFSCARYSWKCCFAGERWWIASERSLHKDE
jgi:hypothetical protein